MSADGWTGTAWAELACLVGARTGLAFSANRRPGAEAGVRRAMARAGFEDVARYRELLARDGDAFDDLMVELTVGETYLFREPAQFDFIRREVLPEIRNRRGPDYLVRVWSAGCASGEEAYSLAILLAEAGLGERASVHATDLSRAALAKARAATYGAWSLRGDGAAAALPYLQRTGDRYTVADAIRRRVDIGYLNLALDVYPSFATGVWGMDLILCRNVLIYFDRSTIGHVARRLHATLADGGWLITGPSDPPLGDEAPYESVVSDAGVFYRRSAAGVRPTAAPSAPAPLPALTLPSVPSPRRAREAPRPARPATGARNPEADAAASVLRVRALANADVAAAEEACAAAAAGHPMSAEVHYLWAVLLAELGRDDEASGAARRALYLDRSLAAAHLLLGTVLRRRGDRDGARRAYRNARDLCAARPAGDEVPLTDGECAGRLSANAEAQLALLEAGGGHR